MVYNPQIEERFWLKFDRATTYNPAFGQLSAPSVANRAQTFYRLDRQAGTYPQSFKARHNPVRGLWVQIADIQRQTFDMFLGSDWADIDAAFADFAQCVLISTDPQRLADNNSIHMMDGVGEHLEGVCLKVCGGIASSGACRCARSEQLQ
jgi:hypothetical protein